MISFTAFGVRFKLPLLTLLVPVLALHLGVDGNAWALLLALGVHELSHIAAARMMGVGIDEIRLMPFGGSARIENPYRLPPHRLIPVAIAGPLSNLLLAMMASSMAYWNWIHPAAAAAHVVPNLVLFMFNILPALPLDGGRMLFALLMPMLGEERALRTGLWTGRLLAAILATTALIGGLRSGIWNLTLIFAAVFIISAEADERSALSKSHAQRLAELLQDASDARPARFYQLDDRSRVQDALALLRPRERSWFVLTSSGAPHALLDDRSLLNHLLKDGAPEARLSELPAWNLSEKRASGAK